MRLQILKDELQQLKEVEDLASESNQHLKAGNSDMTDNSRDSDSIFRSLGSDSGLSDNDNDDRFRTMPALSSHSRHSAGMDKLQVGDETDRWRSQENDGGRGVAAESRFATNPAGRLMTTRMLVGARYVAEEAAKESARRRRFLVSQKSKTERLLKEIKAGHEICKDR